MEKIDAKSVCNTVNENLKLGFDSQIYSLDARDVFGDSGKSLGAWF